MKEHHYRLCIAFCGKAYFGYQRQLPDVPNTVQQTLEEVLRRLFREETLDVTGCSRTDAGVHASEMTLSFSAEKALDPEWLRKELLHQLPHDMQILSAEELPLPFNAQQNCGKSYIYCIRIGEPSVFLRDLTWNWPHFEKKEEIAEALKLLEGKHDFANFTRRTQGIVSTEREIWKTEYALFGSILSFYFSGSGFLNKMVRRIAALLFEIEEGRLHAADFRHALEKKEFPLPDVVAPPRGLYLKKVFYSPEEREKDFLDVPPFLN